MLIEETFVVEAPKDEVARFLLDVPRMAACVPGVEGLHRLDDDRYTATLLFRMGPVQARFKGEVTLDARAAPDTIVATASGRDASTGSVAQVSFSADLVEGIGGSTEIRSVSNVTIRGRLGQFGSGVMSSVSREMVRSFAQCAGHELNSVGSGPSHPSSPRGAVAVIGRGVLSWLREVWRRIFRGSRSGGGSE